MREREGEEGREREEILAQGLSWGNLVPQGTLGNIWGHLSHWGCSWYEVCVGVGVGGELNPSQCPL